jgi:hypothetical protein
MQREESISKVEYKISKPRKKNKTILKRVLIKDRKRRQR